MSESLFDLHGKTAIVTGGATGIGYAIAHALARAGCDLVICSRKLEKCNEAAAKISGLGVKALALACDVSVQTDVQNMVAETISHFGKIDILVNNAGVSGAAKPALEIDFKDWKNTIGINQDGAFLCSQIAAREMVKQGGGKIINVASIGSYLALPFSSDYCTSKGGLLMLTRAMALEFIRHGINVNALCPGFIDTEFSGAKLSDIEQKFISRIPAGRFGCGDDIGGAAVFLASPAANYLVGSSIVIDGGVMLS